jgi:hypothetical protein
MPAAAPFGGFIGVAPSSDPEPPQAKATMHSTHSNDSIAFRDIASLHDGRSRHPRAETARDTTPPPKKIASA